MQHHPEELIALFNSLFEESHNTILVRGDDEPLYLPADSAHPRHRIIFAHGFFASALHEIAHWCIAGKQRRMQVDYGYWYRPDGRNAEEQAAFEEVEARPQALEWIFSDACGKSFEVSIDNLSGVPVDRERFVARVSAARGTYLETGLPARAGQFERALRLAYFGDDQRGAA